MKNYLFTNPLRGMAIVLLTVAMPLSFLLSCNRDKNETVEVVFNPQTSYTLKEKKVETLVSDSGITRYKIITPTWLVFGKASEPYWHFPDGLYIEKFDTMFNVEASIKADTAYYYERRKLWEAKNNVDITNLQGERFETSQIFWDEQNGAVYSDSFICITKEGKLINTGIGFRSNQDFSIWEIYNAGAEITIETKRQATDADTIPTDETQRQAINTDTMPSDSTISVINR